MRKCPKGLFLHRGNWGRLFRLRFHYIFSAGDLAGPLHSLPVNIRNFLVFQLELTGQLGSLLPFAGFLGQHKLIQWPQAASAS